MTDGSHETAGETGLTRRSLLNATGTAVLAGSALIASPRYALAAAQSAPAATFKALLEALQQPASNAWLPSDLSGLVDKFGKTYAADAVFRAQAKDVFAGLQQYSGGDFGGRSPASRLATLQSLCFAGAPRANPGFTDQSQLRSYLDALSSEIRSNAQKAPPPQEPQTAENFFVLSRPYPPPDASFDPTASRPSSDDVARDKVAQSALALVSRIAPPPEREFYSLTT